MDLTDAELQMIEMLRHDQHFTLTINRNEEWHVRLEDRDSGIVGDGGGPTFDVAWDHVSYNRAGSLVQAAAGASSGGPLMSPARTGRFEIDIPKLVRQIVLDVALLHWAAGHGRGLAVINAIVACHHDAKNSDMATLAFLERNVGDAQPDDSPPPEAA